MPCFSGRANHKLLKKDCPAGCACCVNTAYSIGKLCCNERKDNANNPNAVNIFADFLVRLEESEGFGNVLFFIGVLNEGGPGFSTLRDSGMLPAKHCAFTLSASIVEENCTINTVTIEDGVVQSVDGNPDCSTTVPGQTVEIKINGNVVVSGLS